LRDVHELVLLDLKQRDIISPNRDFDIDISLLDKFHDSYVRLSGTKGNQRDREARYNRKLAALSFVKFKIDNQLDNPEGFVYVISNEAWPDYYKIGMTHNPKQRLGQYQTYSPLRDFKLKHWSFWQNRSEGEKLVHRMYEDSLDHEWAKLENKKLQDYLTEIHSKCYLQ